MPDPADRSAPADPLGTEGRRDEWFSDEALRKQAALAAWPEGERPPLSLLIGIGEPRVAPTPHERCVCCGLDAREEAGGEVRPAGRFCSVCLGRGHDEERDDA